MVSVGTRDRGFTLLEAIVAIAVFAMGAAALYAWVNTNLITLQRADAINSRSIMLKSAVEFMSTVDPEVRPSGSMELGDVELVWTSTATAYSADVLDEQNNKTINRATLYLSRVELQKNNNFLYEFDIWLLGVRKVRDASDVVFN